MRTISEQEIISLAPNGGAVMNGRKISSGGGFVSRMRSADDYLLYGRVQGKRKVQLYGFGRFCEGGSACISMQLSQPSVSLQAQYCPFV